MDKRSSSSRPAQIFLVMCFGLILVENLVNIGRDPTDITKTYLLGRVSPFDVSIGMLVIWATCHIGQLQHYLLRPSIFLAVAIIVFAAAQGAIRYGIRASYVSLDIRIFASFFAGIVIGDLMSRTGYFLRALAIVTCSFAALLLYTGSSMNVYNIAEMGRTRWTDYNLYYYWNALLIPCGILGATSALKRSFESFVFWSALFILWFFGVYLSQTRSCLFALLILCGLLALRWWKEISLRTKGALLALLCTGAAVALGGSSIVMAWIAGPSAPAIVDRIRGLQERDQNVDARFDELRVLFDEMQPVDYLFGKGLGGTITSVLEGSDQTSSLHISFFNILLKFGLLSFIWLIFVLIYRLPLRFMRSIAGWRVENRLLPRDIICYPATGALTALTLMSGGFGDIVFMWVGVIYVMYRSDPRSSMLPYRNTRQPVESVGQLSRKRLPVS
jgi:hypothetical protein